MDGPTYTRQHEGCKLSAYPDAGGYSIGYGHHNSDLRSDTIWTQAQCDAAFADDYANACADANYALNGPIDDIRFAALADMAYQMGLAGLSAFADMLSALRVADWPTASAQCLASRYAIETPSRARDNAHVFLTGAFPT